MTQLDQYLRRSRAARAVLSIYRGLTVLRFGAGPELSATWVKEHLAGRFGLSTISHVITELQRIDDRNGYPPLGWTGKKDRRGARVLRAIDEWTVKRLRRAA